MYSWTSLLAVATILCGVAADRAEALTPPIPPLSGTYRVQPGGVVLACGGIVGQCRSYVLEGSIVIASTFVEARIAQSDLRLRDDFGASVFPASDTLPLVGLTGPIEQQGDSTVVELAADGPNGQRVALGLVSVGSIASLVGNLQLALRGTYDEGCCDRFVFDFGNVRLEPDAIDGLALGVQSAPRFVVNVHWSTGGPESLATPERLGSNHGYFWFYTPENPEIFVKVVSACETPFQRVWFFASGLTNLGVRIEVRDLWYGGTRTYTSPRGTPFAAVQDTVGFPCASLP